MEEQKEILYKQGLIDIGEWIEGGPFPTYRELVEREKLRNEEFVFREVERLYFAIERG